MLADLYRNANIRLFIVALLIRKMGNNLNVRQVFKNRSRKIMSKVCIKL